MISVPDEILAKAENEAKRLGLNRSAYFTTAVSEKMEQAEMLRCLPQALQVAALQAELEKKLRLADD